MCLQRGQTWQLSHWLNRRIWRSLLKLKEGCYCPKFPPLPLSCGSIYMYDCSITIHWLPGYGFRSSTRIQRFECTALRRRVWLSRYSVNTCCFRSKSTTWRKTNITTFKLNMNKAVSQERTAVGWNMYHKSAQHLQWSSKLYHRSAQPPQAWTTLYYKSTQPLDETCTARAHRRPKQWLYYRSAQQLHEIWTKRQYKRAHSQGSGSTHIARNAQKTLPFHVQISLECMEENEHNNVTLCALSSDADARLSHNDSSCLTCRGNFIQAVDSSERSPSSVSIYTTTHVTHGNYYSLPYDFV